MHKDINYSQEINRIDMAKCRISREDMEIIFNYILNVNPIHIFLDKLIFSSIVIPK